MSVENLGPASEITEQLGIRNVLEQKQQELDTTLAGLADEIEFWNLKFSDITSEDEQQQRIAWSRLTNEAIRSLNGKWPFKNDYLHVSGSWFVPNATITGESISYPMERQEAFAVVESNGFSVVKIDDRAPQVGMSFVAVGEQTIQTPALQGTFDFLTFADPREVSLIFARPANEESQSTDIAKLHEKLMFYDNLLYLHYHSENSKFFDKTAAEQKKFLVKVIDEISEVLPSPEYGKQAVCEEIIVPYVYRLMADEDRGWCWHRIRSQDGESLMLAGTVDGISVLEASLVSNGHALRNENDLVDEESSVCLVVSVNQSSIPDVFNGQPVYVPLRLAEHVELAVP
jgi:hypothetical protein